MSTAPRRSTGTDIALIAALEGRIAYDGPASAAVDHYRVTA